MNAWASKIEQFGKKCKNQTQTKKERRLKYEENRKNVVSWKLKEERIMA